MIKATVGLPMYRSEEIAEISLESLCRQENIDFEWELLIIEEKEKSFGSKKINKFLPKLKDVGCTRLEYYSIEKWIPLSMKWYHLAKSASSTSECFLLKAADCFSQPDRLRETVSIFLNNEEVDWVQSKRGYFYDIGSESITLFNHDLCFIQSQNGKIPHPCALNMAARTNLLNKIKPSSVRKSVDSHIFRELTSIKQSPLNVGWLESSKWKKGLDTHGLNNISRKRGTMIKRNIPPFEESSINLSDIVPEDIENFLKSLRSSACNHEYDI